MLNSIESLVMTSIVTCHCEKQDNPHFSSTFPNQVFIGWLCLQDELPNESEAWQWHKRLAPGAWGQGGTVPRNSWQPSLSVVSEVHLYISANQLKVGKKQHSWGEGGCEVGKHLRDVCFDVWQLRNRVTFARSKPSGAGQTRNFWIKMRELVAGSRQHSSESRLSRTSLPQQHVVNC